MNTGNCSFGWGRRGTSHETAPHHPLVSPFPLNKQSKHVANVFLFFHQEYRCEASSPSLPSSSLLAPSSPSLPNDLIPAQKGHQLQGGSACSKWDHYHEECQEAQMASSTWALCYSSAASQHPQPGCCLELERLGLPENSVTKKPFRYFLTNPSVTGATMKRTCRDDEHGGSLKSHLGTKFPFKKNVRACLQGEGCLENKN